MDSGLNFRCDYANALLDTIWKDAMSLLAGAHKDVKIKVTVGRVERQALENWLIERQGYASMLTIPGMGPPGCKPEVFGFQLEFLSVDTHLTVRRVYNA